MKMKKNILKIAAGVLLIASVIWGYLPNTEYLHEMTFISNFSGGLLLIIDAVLSLCGKKGVPDILLTNVAVCIITVFLICVGSLTGLYGSFNFAGAFFLLHVVNPPVYIACLLLLFGRAEKEAQTVFTSPILMLCYLLFDYIRFRITGSFVYGLFPSETVTLPFAAKTRLRLSMSTPSTRGNLTHSE